MVGSKGGGIRSAVQQDVLTGEVRGVDAAEKSTGLSELRGSAESPGGNLCHRLLRQGGLWLPGLLGGGGEAAAQALGVETARQEIVDGDVLVGGFAGDARHESGEARPGGAR